MIIEDDIKICELLVDYLAKHNFKSTAKHMPSEGVSYLKSDAVDLVILDVMLPEFDGFEALKRIRSFSGVPVIMLTARGETTDKIVGLELGADDYMSKPFEPRELVARINSIFRRREYTPQTSEKTFGELSINKQYRRVKLLNREIELTALEFDLIDLLSSQPGKKWSRDEIMNSLHGRDSDVFSRSIDIAISRLRQKLGDSKESSKYIQTIWGVGYLFVGGMEQ